MSDPPGEPTAADGLTRITVNLTPRALRAVQKLIVQTGLNKTDVISRAVLTSSLIEDLLDQDGGVLTVRHKDGTEERIHIL